MKFAGEYLSKFILICLLLVVPVALSSCGSLTNPPVPDVLTDNVISWDGNEQNGGLINYIDGKGYLITPNAAQRYTWLTKEYGKDYKPPITEGQGLSEDPSSENFYLETQFMIEFMNMNQRRKSGFSVKEEEEKK